ncbi:unnamed protein product [Schistosoma curassoni]|nr:unnamed protein product [Schistosoma curassoni]
MDQRCYSPSPNWYGPKSPKCCGAFIGKIPRDWFEDELVPVFELVKKILSVSINGGCKILSVCFSIDNCHLFIGVIPKLKAKDE